MKAKLVTITIPVRVIVKDDDNKRRAIEKALYKAVETLQSHGGAFVDSVEDDTLEPYDPTYD